MNLFSYTSLLARKIVIYYNFAAMNYALDTYDLLKDRTEYIEKGWLHVHFANTTLDQIAYLNGAFCYLLGRYFFEEKNEKEISELVHEDILGIYQPKSLTEEALNLKFRYESKDFLKSTSELIKYMNFLSESESYIMDGVNDVMGRIVLSYIESLIEIVKNDDKSLAPLKICEVVFLNIVSAMDRQFLSCFGLNFKAYASYPFFEGVDKAYERIAGSIVD